MILSPAAWVRLSGQAKEQEATSKIFERMNKILGKIALAENFMLRVEHSVLLSHTTP